MSTTLKKSQSFAERGSVMIFVAVIIFAAVLVVGLLIENSRKSLSAKNVQDAVDAAALAAVAEMNGSAKGWSNAKTSAVKVLQQQEIHGSLDLEELKLDQWSPDSDCSGGCIDPFDTSLNKGNFGTSGNAEVKVERGFYWFDEAENKKVFKSVEAGNPEMELEYLDVTNQDSSTPLPGKVPAKYGLPVFILANAVRVTMTLDDIPTIIGKTFGATLGKVERSAIAVSDRSPEHEVAPFAIPACSLLLNTKAHDPEDAMMQLDGYQPGLACSRDLMITETNPDVPGRRDGLARSKVFPRPPLRLNSNGQQMNELNYVSGLSLDGYFGLPARATANTNFATAEELGKYFKSGGSGDYKARLGERFNPVDELVNKSGFYDEHQVEQALADFIQKSTGSKAFTSVFGSINESQWDYDAPTLVRPGLKLNFPHPRIQIGANFNNPIERLLKFPNKSAGGTVDVSTILLGNVGLPEDWANPLCHSRLVTGANNNVPNVNDPSAPTVVSNQARVKPVTIMVVAPSADGYDYCDWEAVFSRTSQTVYRPLPESAPIVVGFVTGYMYDFNVMNLTNTANTSADATPSTPVYKHSTRIIRDNSPEMVMGEDVSTDYEEMENDFFTFVVDYSGAGQCLDDACISGGVIDPSCDTNAVLASPACDKDVAPPSDDTWKDNCFEIDDTISPEYGAALNCGPWPSVTEICGDRDASSGPTDYLPFIECKLDKARMALPNLPEKAEAEFIADFLEADTNYPSQCLRTYAVIKMLDSAYQLAKFDTHCLPQIKPGSYDFRDPDAYEKPKDLTSEYGCGGIRVRLDCGDESNPFKTQPFMVNDNPGVSGASSGVAPMLVK